VKSSATSMTRTSFQRINPVKDKMVIGEAYVLITTVKQRHTGKVVMGH
jgi:hypothetical protein